MPAIYKLHDSRGGGEVLLIGLQNLPNCNDFFDCQPQNK